MSKAPYSITEWNISTPTSIQFKPHSHDQYEIYLFIEGDAHYVVKDRTYTLEPWDMLVMRKHEMHCIHHNSCSRYRRCVLMVSPEFFQQYNCQDYETAFLKAPVGTDNKIAAEIVRSSGLYEAFVKYKKYSEDYTLDKDSPILISTIIEILYLINKATVFSTADLTNTPMKSVLLYLNNRYTDDITLDMLAEKFYLSKHYLCRAFRKATGITVHEYICRKRLALVRDLCAEGMSIGEAALMAGFRDYSSFYRAYTKEYGTSPREDLK